MKNTIFLIFISLFSVQLFATETLTFKFANPRIEYYAPDNYLTFEVYAKGTANGTYLYASQVICDINIANVNTSIPLFVAKGFTSGTFDPPGPPPPVDKYNFVANYNADHLNIAILHNYVLDSYSLESGAYSAVTTAYQLWGTVYVPLLPAASGSTSGISFIESAMGGGNQTYATGVQTAPSAPYNNPLFEGNNFSNLFYARIYNQTSGWTQFDVTASPWVNWSTSVNTSVWDGSATITQTDEIAALADNFRIESGATLTIPANKWLTVTGNFTLNGSATNLVVASGGSLIQSTSGVQATVGRYIGAWGNAFQGWHLLSSPVSAQPFQPTFVSNPPAATEDFYYWDETLALWINSKATTAPPFIVNPYFQGNFEIGKGYLVAYQVGAEKLFNTGALNVSNVTQSGLSYTPTAPYANGITPGWNLLGNPYSSALLWNNGSWILSNVDGLAQVWNELNASYIVISANGIIPAMQGFMVHVPSATGSVTIPSSARTHNPQPWYKTTGSPFIKLVAHNPGAQTAQESVVNFDGQATPGYDGDFDSYFLSGYAPQFYSVAGNAHLAYNTLPILESQTTIPFNFIKTEGFNYTIEAAQIENVPTQVYLTDLKINQTQSLSANPIYAFTAADGDDPARFLLTFGPFTGCGEKNISNNGIYAFENSLYLINPGKARLEVYSITGQKLQSMEIDSPGLFKTTLFLPPAYYVVRLTTGTKVVVTKVFLKS